MSYRRYLTLNDSKTFKRLYLSKYRDKPETKVRAVTGRKLMVKTEHAICRFGGTDKKCRYWGGKKALPLSYLINQNFVYHGNLYEDMLGIEVS